MLKDLSKYENLGTPKYHFELLQTVRKNPSFTWSTIDIDNLFHNRIIDNRTIFDGCLPLLKSIGIVEINSNKELSFDPSFNKYLNSEKQLVDKIVEKLMFSLNDDPIFLEIFSPRFISYDIVYRSIQIENSAFRLKYSNFKQLLIDFGVITDHPTKLIKKFIINSRYKKVFDKVILPEIRKRKIGIDELKKSLELRQIYGEEAEKFVLAFEEKRLSRKKKVDWVAEYSTSDGYDIASFDSVKSTDHDRFIEVKSYAGKPSFFWSRNEIDVARIKKKSYYLYLVNRDKMKESDYCPIIIQDPFQNVLNDKTHWEQRIEKIKLSQLIE
ncbi:MAG: DUF3883 domain-containing protein [Ekhidna sp.]|uniref:DUF3883 domain-containing protein n=1 Tax=Ekhidna sp. TaxID=2608089 RepID=UPI0032ECB8B7